VTSSDEPITIPTEAELAGWLDGAWTRDGRRINGGPFEEPSFVVWLTVAPYFGDLRVHVRGDRHPHDLDRAQAFSGRVGVAANVVTWSHDLDTTERSADHVDSASVIGRPGELLEIGGDYEERWVRSSPAGGFAGVAELHTSDRVLLARLLLCRDVAIAVWNFPEPGGAMLDGNSAWETTRSVAGDVGGLDLATVADALTRPGALPGGWLRVA
jgi:hypothetical protein